MCLSRHKVHAFVSVLCVCMYVSVCVCMCVYGYVYLCIYMYMCMYCLGVYTYGYMSTGVVVCVRVGVQYFSFAAFSVCCLLHNNYLIYLLNYLPFVYMWFYLCVHVCVRMHRCSSSWGRSLIKWHFCTCITIQACLSSPGSFSSMCPAGSVSISTTTTTPWHRLTQHIMTQHITAWHNMAMHCTAHHRQDIGK